MHHTPAPFILITTGEPAGIGPDILLLALPKMRRLAYAARARLLILGDYQVLKARAVMLGLDAPLSDICRLEDMGACALKRALSKVDADVLVHLPCGVQTTPGVLNVVNAHQVKRQLDLAHELALSGAVRALVTAPLQKSVLNDAGILMHDGAKFMGHTEYFASKTGADVTMMLANEMLKVALVTTHIALKDVPCAITPARIKKTLWQVHKTYPAAKIGVCGLNPHAGEGGHLGLEEIETINPALKACQEAGIDCTLARPADTLFAPQNLRQYDVFVAMYHDQGLAVLKSHGMGQSVNVSLGLPYVRTSVDHGTALDLAGTGKVDTRSLLFALKTALLMCTCS